LETKHKRLPEASKAYEEGKHRRYTMLFTVNGGAFAVAKVFSVPSAATVLGSLQLWQLSLGMILFTIVMVVDIFTFGQKMHRHLGDEVFTGYGKAVLILLGVLFAMGWFLVAREDIGGFAMKNDAEVLKQLNIQIGEAESRGDRDWLDDVLAPKLAFQRADRVTIDDRSQFLSKVNASDARQTRIESIDIIGDRAVVKCVVTLMSSGTAKSYHNLRLFVQQSGKWKLLAWANEPV
jgi:hypothetical protein